MAVRSRPTGRVGVLRRLAGLHTNKGVFITTLSFTSQAVDLARSVERVVLVDGARLTDLMIEHEVGVTLRPIKVPKVDSDYFDEKGTSGGACGLT